jgi:hypothetical protein
MSGGFIPPPSSHVLPDKIDGGDKKPDIGPEPLLRLTSRQEGRLRDHLDGRLTDLERDSKTQCVSALPLPSVSSSFSGFGSLEALLIRLRPILRLILQIPPVEPWSSLRTSYLLAYTGSMINYITSLPLLSQDHDSNHEEQAGQVMQDTIDYLNEVDNAWRTVLRGNAWVVDPSQPESGKAVRVDYAGTVGQTERLVPPILI